MISPISFYRRSYTLYWLLLQRNIVGQSAKNMWFLRAWPLSTAGIFTYSIVKGTPRKRGRKEYKRQRLGRNDLKQCPVDRMWLTYSWTHSSGYLHNICSRQGLPTCHHGWWRGSCGPTHPRDCLEGGFISLWFGHWHVAYAFTDNQWNLFMKAALMNRSELPWK